MADLTNAQLITLGNHIRANTDQEVIDALAVGSSTNLAEWYNRVASPNFYVFVDYVDEADIKNMGIDWTQHLSLNAVQLSVFGQLMSGGFDPRPDSVRTALASIFAGAGQANTRNQLLSLSTKLASNVEKLFAVNGTGPAGGDGSSATNSALAVVYGTVSARQITQALRLTA